MKKIIKRYYKLLKDLKGIFVGQTHFKKLLTFQNFIEILHCCMTENKKTSGTENKIIFDQICWQELL